MVETTTLVCDICEKDGMNKRLYRLHLLKILKFENAMFAVGSKEFSSRESLQVLVKQHSVGRD